MGISGDMLVAACYSFMDERKREQFAHAVESACNEFGGRADIIQIKVDQFAGFSVGWKLRDLKIARTAQEAHEMLDAFAQRLELSTTSREFVERAFNDLIDAEAKAHRVPRDKVHLHELGRSAGLMNIASAGLCVDLLELEPERIIGSYISIGDGEVDTAHGRLSVPPPATARLLLNMRFRFGPFQGEMATPTGVALVRNLVGSQKDTLPDEGRLGVGFGSREFDGTRGFVRLFEAEDEREAE